MALSLDDSTIVIDIIIVLLLSHSQCCRKQTPVHYCITDTSTVYRQKFTVWSLILVLLLIVIDIKLTDC